MKKIHYKIIGILNLRGTEFQFEPLFFSYLLIDFSNNSENYIGWLYIKSKCNENLENYLKKNNVFLKSYDKIFEELKKIKLQKVFINTKTCNYFLVNLIKEENVIKSNFSKIEELKVKMRMKKKL